MPGFQPDMALKMPEVAATHPVGVFNAEHRIILGNLDDLQAILVKLLKAKSWEDIATETRRLREISDLLLETESHHQREEQVLFPRMEKHGVTGPPRVMRLEHEELRTRKKALSALAKQSGQMDFGEFVRGVQEAAGYIIANLRMHIFKEDNILYPKALEVLEPGEWAELQPDLDRVGYCPFTPGK